MHEQRGRARAGAQRHVDVLAAQAEARAVGDDLRARVVPLALEGDTPVLDRLAVEPGRLGGSERGRGDRRVAVLDEPLLPLVARELPCAEPHEHDERSNDEHEQGRRSAGGAWIDCTASRRHQPPRLPAAAFCILGAPPPHPRESRCPDYRT